RGWEGWKRGVSREPFSGTLRRLRGPRLPTPRLLRPAGGEARELFEAVAVQERPREADEVGPQPPKRVDRIFRQAGIAHLMGRAQVLHVDGMPQPIRAGVVCGDRDPGAGLELERPAPALEAGDRGRPAVDLLFADVGALETVGAHHVLEEPGALDEQLVVRPL